MGLTRRDALSLAALGASAVAASALAGCGAAQDQSASTDGAISVSNSINAQVIATPSAIERTLAAMTTEQKVAQLFFVTPERLTGYDTVTSAGPVTQAALASYPVGGICYFGQNITGADQLRTMLSSTSAMTRQAGAGIPAFLAVDEEGGPEVARVANSGFFDVERFPSMATVGASGDASEAATVGSTIGTYLLDIGFNVDFAPDADVLTNPDSPIVRYRSFSSDPNVCADMVSAEVAAMLATGCQPCVKHFPGHGDTATDTHEGPATTNRTLDDLESCEFLPFEAGIAAGVPFVMVGHISTPTATGDDLPASLSSTMMTDILRGDLGFDGVIISDSFGMGAITLSHSSADAAVSFFQAGGDMCLMPEDFSAAYQGVLDAVNAGTLSMDRVNESVLRILAVKESAGLIS